MQIICPQLYDVKWLFLYKNSHVLRGAFNKFPDFLVQAFKIVVDS